MHPTAWMGQSECADGQNLFLNLGVSGPLMEFVGEVACRSGCD